MHYSFLADIIVALHVLYVGFIVIGEIVIVLGWLCGLNFVRNIKFRVCHLLAVVVVVLETVFGITCPLTLWEDNLRILSGQTVNEGTFIGRFLHNILFYDLPTWVFSTIYAITALLVVITLVCIPPRRARHDIST